MHGNLIASMVYISNLLQLQGSVTEISRLLVPINFNGNHWILLVRSKFVYAANGIGMKLHGNVICYFEWRKIISYTFKWLKRRLSVTNLSLENNLPIDVLNECSSRYRGETCHL